jgi:hypothetical protein
LRVDVVTGARGLQRFLDAPKRLYAPSSPWVAPLDFERRRFFDPQRNAFFREAEIAFFIAVDAGGDDIGRIAAIDHPLHNRVHSSSLGFFGFFDARDDARAAEMLLDAACDWVARRGYRRIHGPVNPSTNHECGLLVEGFDLPPMVQMTYNFPYYERLLLENGFSGVQDLVALVYEVDDSVPERLKRALEVFQKRHSFEIRPVNLKRFDEELARIKLIYNEAWSANWGFVPLTDGEIERIAKDLRPFVYPDLCLFAEVRGEPAGFCLALPDINQALKPLRGRLFPIGWARLLWGLRRIDALRAMVLGIRPGFRKLGIDYAFYYHGLRAAQRRRIRRFEVSWVLAHNVELLRPVERFGARVYKRYRLYEKDLA